MTEPAPDTRPQPKYGQYAPLGTPVHVPEPVAPPAPPVPAARNRSRDVMITTVLLLLGVFDVALSFPSFANFASALAQVYTQFGIEGAPAPAAVAPFGLAINISRIAILAIAIAVSLLLISRQRRAFWVPLVGWAVAGIVSSILIGVVMLNDPAYMGWLTTQ